MVQKVNDSADFTRTEGCISIRRLTPNVGDIETFYTEIVAPAALVIYPMELLLTVLSLVVAVYAVTPREGQLSLRLRLKALDWMFLAFIFLGTLYLSYYPFFEAHGLAKAAKSWPTGLAPDKSVSLLLVFASIVLFLRLKFNRLSPGQIWKFSELAQDLLWNGSAAELLALIDKNALAFFKILNCDYWDARLRTKFAPPVTFEAIIHRLEAEKEIQN